MPGVVRAGEQAPLQRLGHEHLAARRDDGRVELGEQPVRVAVRREHDVVRLELVDRLDAVVLAQLGSGLGGSRGQPAHPAGRLKRSIGWMEDRAVEPAAKRVRQLVAPLGREAVLAEGLVLGLELGPLGGIGGQPQASGAPEGVARQLLEPVEIALRPAPETLRTLGAEVAPCLVVGGRAAAQREAAVAPARAAGDLARLVEDDALPRLCKCERAGTAGHPAAHDRHVHRPRRPVLGLGKARARFGEPVGARHDVAILARQPHPPVAGRRPPQRAPASSSSASAVATAGASSPVSRMSWSAPAGSFASAASTAAAVSPSWSGGDSSADDPKRFQHVLRARQRGRAEPEQRIRAG